MPRQWASLSGEWGFGREGILTLGGPRRLICVCSPPKKPRRTAPGVMFSKPQETSGFKAPKQGQHLHLFEQAAA